MQKSQLFLYWSPDVDRTLSSIFHNSLSTGWRMTSTRVLFKPSTHHTPVGTYKCYFDVTLTWILNMTFTHLPCYCWRCSVVPWSGLLDDVTRHKALFDSSTRGDTMLHVIVHDSKERALLVLRAKLDRVHEEFNACSLSALKPQVFRVPPRTSTPLEAITIQVSFPGASRTRVFSCRARKKGRNK